MEGKPTLAPKAAAVVDDVEVRCKELMERLGGDAGTQNIDRILRLPGTTNLPNKTKLKKGRVVCPTSLVRFNGATCKLEDFPPATDTADTNSEQNEQDAAQTQNDKDKLEQTIRDGAPVGERSERVWYVLNEMLRRGYAPPRILKTLLDRRLGISDHIYDQANPSDYADRQVVKAIEQIDLRRGEGGVPYNVPSNIRVALLKMGVEITYDSFADRQLLSGLKDFGPALDDAAILRIWFVLDQRFHFRPGKELLFDVIKDTARLNNFHPVRDYLDSLHWDETKRLDRWLITYAGAEDSKYTRAVGVLLPIAAVRRVRQPGVKFDEMVVLESPEQGTNKSSGLEILAVRKEWFSDDLPLNADTKRVIESLRGRWIVEAAELSGIRHADVEHLKAFLSRTVDRARLAYDRVSTEYLRQCVVIGTTNSEQYLRDTTGHRRFWPVRVKQFDLAALRRDRDQLWAEAAAREAAGESIRLEPKLWSAAADEQMLRAIADPWVDALAHVLGDNKKGKIAAASVWVMLDMKEGMRMQWHNARMGDAMRKLGWVRPNKAGLVSIEGRLVSGYVKGKPPWPTIKVDRTQHQLYVELDTSPSGGLRGPNRGV
jgi:Virulence-associated protein E